MKKGVEPFDIYLLNKLVINKNQIILFHYIPATRSRTATLLRLHPNYQSLNGFY